MKSTTEDFNKIYLGDKEITLKSLYSGSEYVGVLHKPSNFPFRELGSYEVGDAVFWDYKERYFKVISPGNIKKITDTLRYMPIGVVAIPSSHDVYGTGECGVVALRYASVYSPDSGETEIQYGSELRYISLGDGISTIPELKKYNNVNCIILDDTKVNYRLTSTSMSYLPSDDFSKEISLDGVAYYTLSSDVFGVCYTPSPYNKDGSRNESYFATGPIQTIEPVLGPFNPNTTDGLSINWSIRKGNWKESANSNAKDGKQFTSVSPGHSRSTVIRCTFSGKTGKITFACKSDGEPGYDFLTIGELDKMCDRSTFGTSLKGQSGKLQKLSFDIPDDGEHYVEFCYSKDSSGDTAPDCAVVYVDGGGNLQVITLGQYGSGAESNILSDFSGKLNTEILCSKATAQANWKTDTTLLNFTNEGYYPAACACWRYRIPDTTSPGDWYLPACGELGYVVARLKKINNTIAILLAHTGRDMAKVRGVDYLPSTCTGSNGLGYTINAGSGKCENFYARGAARPFTRIK